MKGSHVLFTKNKDDWETPKDLYDALDREFSFDLDLAATAKNSKCWQYIDDIDKYETKPAIDGFAFCNPPYSKQRKFVEFVLKHNLPTVFLLPARTDTKLFHEYLYNKENIEIRFIKGRLRFSHSNTNAPFPSMIVIFIPKEFLMASIPPEKTVQSFSSSSPPGFPYEEEHIVKRIKQLIERLSQQSTTLTACDLPEGFSSIIDEINFLHGRYQLLQYRKTMPNINTQLMDPLHISPQFNSAQFNRV